MNTDQLYQLVVAQLRDDGLADVAAQLQFLLLGVSAYDVPRNRLADLVNTASQSRDPRLNRAPVADNLADVGISDMYVGQLDTTPLNRDAVFDVPHVREVLDIQLNSPVKLMKTLEDRQVLCYVTEDNTVHIVDVDRTISDYLRTSVNSDFYEIQKYFLPQENITCIALHPFKDLVAIGTESGFIYIYPYTSINYNTLIRKIQDISSVIGLYWDVSGRYLYTTVIDKCMRIIDITTGTTYTPEITAIPNNLSDKQSSNNIKNEVKPEIKPDKLKDENIEAENGADNNSTDIKTEEDIDLKDIPVSVQSSGDGKTLVVITSNGSVELWDRTLLKPRGKVVLKHSSNSDNDDNNNEKNKINEEEMDTSSTDGKNNNKLTYSQAKELASFVHDTRYLLVNDMWANVVNLYNVENPDNPEMSYKVDIEEDGQVVSSCFSYDSSLLLIFTDRGRCLFVQADKGSRLATYTPASESLSPCWAVSGCSQTLYVGLGRRLAVCRF